MPDKNVIEIDVEEWLCTTKEIRRLKERNEILSAEKAQLEEIIAALAGLKLDAQER